jgi:hypothetical protein
MNGVKIEGLSSQSGENFEKKQKMKIKDRIFISREINSPSSPMFRSGEGRNDRTMNEEENHEEYYNYLLNSKRELNVERMGNFGFPRDKSPSSNSGEHSKSSAVLRTSVDFPELAKENGEKTYKRSMYRTSKIISMNEIMAKENGTYTCSNCGK